MIPVPLAVALLMLPMTANAHEGHNAGAEQLSFDNLTILLLVAVGLAYAIGTARLWRKAGTGHGVRTWQGACFAAGWVSLAIAMLSPLHDWAERSLTAHMIEHEILVAVAAPLIAVSRPLGAMIWLLPATGRRVVGRWPQARAFRAVWRFISEPLVATILHAVAIWAWHLPVLFDAALADESLHWLQHLSFFGTGLLFWSALIGSGASHVRYGQAVGHLFTTSAHMSLLGALLTLSSTAWYVADRQPLARMSLMTLQDQQIAGLVMWVPAGLIYAGAAIAIAGLWIAESAGAAPRHA